MSFIHIWRRQIMYESLNWLHQILKTEKGINLPEYANAVQSLSLKSLSLRPPAKSRALEGPHRLLMFYLQIIKGFLIRTSKLVLINQKYDRTPQKMPTSTPPPSHRQKSLKQSVSTQLVSSSLQVRLGLMIELEPKVWASWRKASNPILDCQWNTRCIFWWSFGLL